MADNSSAMKRRRPRRSKGCEACRLRRMKCDEQRPHCHECIKRGTESECVYGAGQIIFQSENAFVEQNYVLTKPKKRKANGTDGINGNNRASPTHPKRPVKAQFILENGTSSYHDDLYGEPHPGGFDLDKTGSATGSHDSNGSYGDNAPERLSTPLSQTGSLPSQYGGLAPTPASYTGYEGNSWSRHPSNASEVVIPATSLTWEAVSSSAGLLPFQPQQQRRHQASQNRAFARNGGGLQNLMQFHSGQVKDDDDTGGLDGVVTRRQFLSADEILPGKGYQSWTSRLNPRQLISLQDHALHSFFNVWLPSELILGEPELWRGTLTNGLHGSPMLREIVLAIARVQMMPSDVNTRRENAVSAMEHYSAGVMQLQAALDDPTRVLDDNVLVATVLHGTFEMVLGMDIERLAVHLDGAKRLLRMRGPMVHCRDGSLAQNIFAGISADAARTALQDRTRTFFSEPEWLEATRLLKPTIFNKWAGTELFVLTLRLTEVVADGRRDMAAAIRLEADIKAERLRALPEPTYVSNALLMQRSPRAHALKLDESPFGTESLSYDEPLSNQYWYTQMAITFDYLLLTLHSVYIELSAQDHGQLDYECMVDLVLCVQYMAHDPANMTVATITGYWQPLIYCVHYARNVAELNWILHCFDITGIESAHHFGNMSKAWIAKACEAPCMTDLEKRILKGYLLEKGVADVKHYTSELEVAEAQGIGFRSAMDGIRPTRVALA
ncbi:hypothetical protein PYCC9005_001538 [Savitreella phatthalungensis]